MELECFRAVHDGRAMKARFEEAKIRDLIDPKPKSVTNVSVTASAHQTKAGQASPRDRGQRGDRGPHGGSLSKFGDRSRCFTCGASGHFAKQCPQRGKQKSSETPGRSLGSGHSSTVAQVASHDNDQGKSHQKSELQWQEVELNDPLTKVTATMHGIVSESFERNAQLGPIPTAKVKLEGSETEALLDTGSPVTIVLLQFLLEALAKQKRIDQSPGDWRQMVEKRFEPSSVNLQNYS